MRLTGIFASRADAEYARRALLDAGVTPDNMAMSVSQTRDGIAAEAPGESYENQPGEPRSEDRAAPYNEAVRSGVCALTVDVYSDGERDRLGRLLRENGAREVTTPRD